MYLILKVVKSLVTTTLVLLPVDYGHRFRCAVGTRSIRFNRPRDVSLGGHWGILSVNQIH